MRIPVSMALASVLCGGVLAATVPQHSPKDYYFSRPNMPTNIAGRVMGMPPAYSVMRSEDVAWLYEAYCERAALLSRGWRGMTSNAVLRAEFGKWPLSETNRFARWTTAAEPTVDGGLATNVIVGYNWTTNLGSGVDHAAIEAFRFDRLDINGKIILANTLAQPDGWLSTDNGKLRTAAANVTELYSTMVTNVWTRSVATNGWTNAVSLIKMTMTNGTESVFTNEWRAFAPGTRELATTNVRSRSLVDLVFNGGVAACYTNEAPNFGLWRGTYRAAVVTNLYSWLEGMTRLGNDAIMTNRFRTLRYQWYNDDTRTTTNSAGHMFYYTASRQAGRAKGEPSWEDVIGYDYRPDQDVGSLSFSSGWGTNAVMAGGQNRMASARLWAVAFVEHNEHASASSHDDSGESWSTNRYFAAVVPVGTAGQIAAAPNYGMVATASVNLRSLYEAALNAVGVPILSRGWAPSLRFPVPDPGEYSSSSSASVDVSCDFSFVVVVDFAPRASLPGWND